MGRPGKAAATPSAQEKRDVKAEKRRQNERHLAFLTRARASMAFYQEQIKQAQEAIGKYSGLDYPEFQELVGQAQEALPEFARALETLQESIENEVQEHTFIMSTLEALESGEGNFPAHTLEEYLKKRGEDEETKERDPLERTRRKRYSLEDLDRMIAELRNERYGAGLSIEA